MKWWSLGFVRLFTVLALSVYSGGPLAGQTDIPITVAVGTQSLTVPWHTSPVTYRFNPAAYVSTDGVLKSGDSWRLFFAVNVGFFRHYWWMTGVSLEPEIGVGRSLPGGFYTDMRFGIGYLHYFWRRERLELHDGSYEPAADWGSPSFLIPVSATLGYRGDLDDPLPVSPFISVRWAVQGLLHSELPVATHLFLLGGLRIERKTAGVGGGS